MDISQDTPQVTPEKTHPEQGTSTIADDQNISTESNSKQTEKSEDASKTADKKSKV
ncbi:hypothetical protein CHS0354_016067 [Potamilus streckersoni]|uniref:Uncharacterized protein n=1 Tax=Potamilus streckersoni TaxID=2493646 RepID=A0AAE0W4G1_9BIVA|nr:hypothetical protein CHS0354_016067 [Potamilus streckersoni]